MLKTNVYDRLAVLKSNAFSKKKKKCKFSLKRNIPNVDDLL